VKICTGGVECLLYLLAYFRVVLGIQAVSADTSIPAVLFLEFNLATNQSSISQVHQMMSESISMTKIDDQTLAIVGSAHWVTTMDFVTKKETIMDWIKIEQIIASFHEAIEYEDWNSIEALSITKAGSFLYVGHTMGIIAYTFGELEQRNVRS